MATFPSRGCSASMVHSKMDLLLSVSNPGRTPCTVPGTSVGNRGMGTAWNPPWIRRKVPEGLAGIAWMRRSPESTTPGSVQEIRPPRGSSRVPSSKKTLGDAGRLKPSRALAFGAEPSLVPSQKGFWSTKGSEIQKWEQNFAYRPPKRHKLPRCFIKLHKISEVITKPGLIPNLNDTLWN